MFFFSRKLSFLFLDDQQRSYYLTQVSYISSWIQYVYLQVEGVQTFTTQLIFSMASEKLFCPLQRLSCLFVLLFYTFLAYAVKSLKVRFSPFFYFPFRIVKFGIGLLKMEYFSCLLFPFLRRDPGLGYFLKGRRLNLLS